MQAIRTALFGEPDYQPIPQLHDDNSDGNFVDGDDYESNPNNGLKQPPTSTNGNNYNDITYNDTNTTCLQDCNTAITLTRQERFIGFIILFLLGWFLSLSTLHSYQTLFLRPLTFCLWYTIGNILSLLSNFFLYGPFQQLILMFSSPHRMFSIFYIFTIVMTLILSFKHADLRVIIGIVILQFIASILYTLSFLLSGTCGKALTWIFKFGLNTNTTGNNNTFDEWG